MEIGNCLANGEKMENCSRIKDGNGRLELEEVELRSIWEKHFFIFII